MKKILGLVVVGVLGLIAFQARADKGLGTCSTSTATLSELHLKPAADGGFDAFVCGRSLLTDGGSTNTFLKTQCADCTAATFANIPAACKTAWQTAHCP